MPDALGAHRHLHSRGAVHALDLARGAAAFQANDNAATTELANKCAQIEGPFKAQALVRFADAVFRSGEVARAKQMYRILIDKKSPRSARDAQKKTIACNRALKLPERDGL